MKPRCLSNWGLVLSLSLGVSTGALARSPTVNTVNSSNHLGFKIIAEASALDATPKNRFISPLSAHLALSMTLNGADHHTRDQLMTILGYPLTASLEEINQQNLGLVKALFKAPLTEEEKARRSQERGLPPVFTILNSAWSTNGGSHPEKRYDFSNAFMKDLGAYYQVKKAISLDFKQESSVDLINEWSKEATHGLIPQIIDAKTLQNLLWVLLNSTYLEAQWEKAFAQTTETLSFQRWDGQRVPMIKMVQSRTINVAQLADSLVVELCLNASQLRVYMVVPQDAQAFSKLQNGSRKIWSQEFWDKVFGQRELRTVRLAMPPFNITDEVLLLENESLTKKLGLNFLFKDTTDLGRMDAPASPPSKVGIIKQSTKLEWSDKGIKAAAATIVGGSERTSAPGPVLNLTIDRPFYFAVYDPETQAFLFLGQLVDPEQK